MVTMTAATLVALGCVAVATFRGPRWLLAGAAVGVSGYVVVKRYRVL